MMIVEAAMQEDVKVIGISILSGAHQVLVTRIINLLNEKGLGHIPLLVGGIIPENDVDELSQLGVAGVFGPGTSTSEIVALVQDVVS